jgi:hypothetical protein
MSFPASHLDIKIIYLDQEEVNCHWEEYGTNVKSKTFKLKRKETMEELNRFIDEVINMAISKKYITAEDAHQFLNWVPSSFHGFIQ